MKIHYFRSQRWRRRPYAKIKEEDFDSGAVRYQMPKNWMALKFLEQAKSLGRPPPVLSLISAHGV